MCLNRTDVAFNLPSNNHRFVAAKISNIGIELIHQAAGNGEFHQQSWPSQQKKRLSQPIKKNWISTTIHQLAMLAHNSLVWSTNLAAFSFGTSFAFFLHLADDDHSIEQKHTNKQTNKITVPHSIHYKHPSSHEQ